MKYLLVLAVVLVVYALVRSKQRSIAPRARPPASVPPPEEMVRCARCGVHLPHSAALHAEGRSYCCSAHLPGR